MMGDLLRWRIFVVGVPRSGTTLVQSLLASHSLLTSFTESHFLSRHVGLPPGGRPALLTSDPTPALRAFLAENGLTPDAATALMRRVGWERGIRWPRLLRAREAARAFLDVLDAVAEDRGRRGWIEKTPRHLRFIPFLDSVTDEGRAPRFVHVVRRGVDAVASLHRASREWERAYDVDACIRRWNEDLARSLSRLHSARDHFVFYEDLTTAPEATLKRILAALGLAWEESILRDYGRTAETLVAHGEHWKEGVDRALAPSTASRAHLSVEQRARIVRGLASERYDRLYALKGLDGGGSHDG